METKTLVKELEGLQTVETIQKKLRIKRSTALKYISLLRKEGYVRTFGGWKQVRMYLIDPKRETEKGTGYYETINKYSPIKLAISKEIKVVGRKLSVEEVIAWAIEKREFRAILAALVLFRKVKNWPKLYQEAKKRDVRRKVGALYEVTQKIMKIRRMDKRTEKSLLTAKGESRFIIEGLKSKDFKSIEKKWRVYVPFNKADLMRYEE